MEFPIHTTWRALGARLAVAGGAGTALCGLMLDLPVRVAALRGGLVLLASLGVTRLVAKGLEHNERVERAQAAKVAEVAEEGASGRG